MAQPVIITFPAASTTALAPVSSGNGTLSLLQGYPVYLPGIQRLIDFESVDDNSLMHFTITGVDIYGTSHTENVTGPDNEITTSVNEYHRIDSIVASAAYTNTSVGVGVTGKTQWIPLNTNCINFNTLIAADVGVGASLTYSVNQTFSPLQSYNQYGQFIANITPTSWAIDAVLTNKTVDSALGSTIPAVAYQGVITTSNATSLILTVLQQGVI